MKQFGLIGYPLGHSFSQKYFTEKFSKMGIQDTHRYDLFELPEIEEFPNLWKDNPDLIGMNVTVPHKQNVMKFLDRLDASAEKVGAVNVIKKVGKELVGYNSDMFGFMNSVADYFEAIDGPKSALILGGGGAAKAVEAGLTTLGVDYKVVSRVEGKEDLTYHELSENPKLVRSVQMIVNTTPLGMHPKTEAKPDLPYDVIHSEQYLYDLVYNPEETAFMHEGKIHGARVKNGLEMLHLQADKAWEIWNE